MYKIHNFHGGTIEMSEKTRDKILYVIILLSLILMVFQPYRIWSKAPYNIMGFLYALVMAIFYFGWLYFGKTEERDYKKADKKLSKKPNLKTASKEEVLDAFKKAASHKLSITNLYYKKYKYGDTYNLILNDKEIPVYADIKKVQDYHVEVIFKYVNDKLTIMNPEVVENPDKYKIFCGKEPSRAGGVVIVDRDTLETQREERERYEEWLDNWDRSTEETQRWREEQQKKKQEQEMIMQQEEDEERKRLQDLEDYAYAAYSDESERQEYLRENGYYGF